MGSDAEETFQKQSRLSVVTNPNTTSSIKKKGVIYVN